MLTIYIVNTGRETSNLANYVYSVHVNHKQIADGNINGHNRADGWAALIKLIADQNLFADKTKQAATPCQICQTPTSYEAQDVPLCHRCAVVVLEYVRGPDFVHALDNATQYLRRINGTTPNQAGLLHPRNSLIEL